MTDWKERAERAEAELARLRAQVPVGWIGPSGFTHNTATNRMWMRESPKLAAKLSPVYAAPPAQPAEPVDGFGGNLDEAFDTAAEPVQRLSDSGLRDKIHDALASELSWCAYDCTRVWEAWSVGTMTQDDFTPVDERLGDIVSTVLSAIESALQPGWRDDLVNGLMGSTISETCRADAAEAAIESIADLLDSHNDDMHSVYGCRPVEKVAKARAIAIAAMLEAAPKATK